MASSNHIPVWLVTLLGKKFFNPCKIHETSKKNEKNMYCLDCCSSLCPNCIPSHNSHRLLQIYRNLYKDVVKVDDMEKQTDCASIQVYKSNGEKVVFLNSRGKSKSCGSGKNSCSCGHNFEQPYLYCSLYCKVMQPVISECASTSTASSNKAREK